MRKLLLSVLMIALTAPVAFAAPAPGDDAPKDGPRKERRADGDGPRRGGPMGALRQLDLTDDQKAEVKSIFDGVHESAQAYREANAETVKKLMGDLKAAREAGDKEAGEAARAELKKIHEASPMFAAFQKVVSDVLTDAQRDKLAEMREHRGDRPRGPRGDKNAPVEG